MQRQLSLRTFLTRLILWCIVPLLLLNAYFAFNNILSIKSQNNEDAEGFVTNLAASIDQDLQSRINGLKIIAASPMLGEPGRRAELYQLAQGYHQGFGSHVHIADADLNILLYTRVPFGSRLPKYTPATLPSATSSVLQTGKPVIGDRFFGQIAKKPMVAIAVPGFKGTQVAFLVLTTIETSQLQHHLAQQHLPAGWTIRILDRAGGVLAHYPVPRPGGSADTEHPQRFSTRSGLSGWTIQLEIAPIIQRQRIVRAATWLGLVILLATLASILGGLLASRRLSADFAKLVRPSTARHSPFLIEEVSAISQDLDTSRAARVESEQRFRATFEQAAVGMALVAPDGHFLRVNRRLCEMVDYPEAELLSKSFQLITHPDDFESDLACNQQMLAGAINSHTREKRYVRRDGEIIWVNRSVSLIRNPDGSPSCFVSVTEDISERKQTEQQIQEMNASLESRVAERTARLVESEAFVQEILNSISSQIAVIDPRGNILAINQAWRRFSQENSTDPGCDAPCTGVGTNYLDICRSAKLDDSQKAHDGILAVLNGRIASFSFEYPCHSPDEERWFLMTVTPLRGGTSGAVVVHADISKRKLAEEKIAQLAFYDPLTNLANRRLFLDRLKQALAASRRSGLFGALLFLDLDNFKRVNDSYGHDAGDRLLTESARRVQACVREVDTVARLGGDEFVVMLGQLTDDRAGSARLAEEVGEKILNGLSAPYLLTIDRKGEAETLVEHQCTVSIGIALFGQSDADQYAILKRADMAMYQAKQAGRNMLRFAPELFGLAGEGNIEQGKLLQLNWNVAYQSGHPLIDQQHQALFDRVNQLLSAMLTHEGRSAVALLIDALIEEVTQHFRDEEQLILAAGFPGAVAHAAIHRKLSERAVEVTQKYRAGELDIGGLFSFFAHEVVVQHILGADRGYFPCFQPAPDT
jgi:diguanylate cyclase (GGDEF)-like protein/PAS domain S-box-containing protein/hemerythrin-like metal-binding protein